MTKEEIKGKNFEKSVQKLKYIFLSSVPSAKYFDIKEWNADEIWDDGYTMDITFDYTGSDEEDMESFGDNIRWACETIRNSLENFPINKDGKLVSNEKISLNGSIMRVDYNFDEKCIINLFLRGYFDEY